MRIVSFRHDGTATYGVVTEDGVVDAGRALGPELPTVGAVLRAGALDRLRELAAELAPVAPIDEVELLPPVTDPGKILGTGLNYVDHRDEGQHEPTKHPTMFTRFADTQIGHGAPLVKPAVSQWFDYEGELAVVLGAGGFQVDQADAMAMVAGYACYNDASVRDWQLHTTQWIPGKNFPGTGAFGPWLVTADEISDPGALELLTRVNGEVRQQAFVKELIFPISKLIEYVSTFTPLSPGDVIVTGTPGGAGMFMKPPAFLAAGDVVEVEISQIGVLRNEVAAA